MISPKHLLTFVVGLCICNNSLSQTDQAYFTQLTTMDGLSSNSINTLYQDSKGFMWISTWNGLDRYDGNEFISHRTSPKWKRESSPFILEDSLGNLWIADPYDSDSVVECAFPDEKALPFDYITKIVFDPEDHLWIATTDGLFRYRPGEDSVMPFDGIEYPDNKCIYDFLFDNEGNLWVAFDYNQVKYDFQRQSTDYYHGPEGAKLFTRRIFQASNGNILFGTSTGVYYLEPGQDQIKRLLEKVYVSSICEDLSHNLWIGTFYDGVFVGNAEFNAVKNLSLNIRNQSLSSYSVNGILDDSTRGLWIHESDHGLLYHDLRTGKTREIDSEFRKGRMVYLEKKRELWYYSKDQLLCYNAKDTSIQSFKLPPPAYLNERKKNRLQTYVRTETNYC